MNTSRFIRTLLGISVCILFQNSGNAQASWAGKAASELIAALVQKFGPQGAKELAELGGEALAKDTLEKAVQEGGQQLAERIATLTVEHGAGLLKVAEQSPAKFVAAFDELTPMVQKAVAQDIVREPELMARLFSSIGKDALEDAAKYPGAGTKVLDVLGQEGAQTLGQMTTADQAIQLGRLAPQIAKVAEPERQQLMKMISESPNRILDLLENHPKVLFTTAGVASFIAAKKQLLGGFEIRTDKDGKLIGVYKPGFIQKMSEQAAETFKAPLAGLICIAGLIMLAWGGIKLWGVLSLEKAKVRIKEAQIAQESQRGKEQPK